MYADTLFCFLVHILHNLSERNDHTIAGVQPGSKGHHAGCDWDARQTLVLVQSPVGIYMNLRRIMYTTTTVWFSRSTLRV